LCLSNWYSYPKLYKELHERRTNAFMCVRVTENIQISRGETVESEDAERRTSN